jgi:hypothetical protein
VRSNFYAGEPNQPGDVLYQPGDCSRRVRDGYGQHCFHLNHHARELLVYGDRHSGNDYRNNGRERHSERQLWRFGWDGFAIFGHAWRYGDRYDHGYLGRRLRGNCDIKLLADLFAERGQRSSFLHWAVVATDAEFRNGDRDSDSDHDWGNQQ